MSAVSGRAPDRKDEATKQQNLAELAEMELVATGHHWDVPERFSENKSRVVFLRRLRFQSIEGVNCLCLF